MLFDLLGKREQDADFGRETSRIDSGVSVRTEEDVGRSWESADAGVAIWIDEITGVIRTIYAFAGRTSDYGRYSGPLPGGITMDDPQLVVEQKLGAPTKRNDSGAMWSLDGVDLFVSYTKKGNIKQVSVSLRAG